MTKFTTKFLIFMKIVNLIIKFLGHSLALIIEIIGFIGGFFWAISTKWEYEPVILLIVSFLGIISYFVFKASKDRERPYIDFEVKRGSSMAYPPKFVKESPKTEGHFDDIKPDGVYLFEFQIKYKLIIRNNSNLIAYYPKIYLNTKDLLYSSKEDNYSNPISITTPKTLDLELRITKKMIHSESNRVLQKENLPDVIKNLSLIATYQNEQRDSYSTKYTVLDGNCYGKKTKISNDYIEMKF